MEQNLPVVAKKAWNIVRVMFYMLRKGISKAKLISDLNMLMKRGKLAGKAAFHNLMFHHIHHRSAASSTTTASATTSDDEGQLSFHTPLHEFEFSCSNSPAYPNLDLPFHFKKRKQKHLHAPPSIDQLAAEMLDSVAASPALPGFGRTPVVRQLRVTDSPFPLRDVEGDNHIDEAAEEFIAKFYKNLMMQSPMVHQVEYR